MTLGIACIIAGGIIFLKSELRYGAGFWIAVAGILLVIHSIWRVVSGQ